MRILAIMAVLALTACSAATDTGDSGTSSSCRVPDGTAYMMKWTNKGGNCGNVPDSLIIVGSTGASMTCTTISETKTACGGTGSQECTNTITGDKTGTSSSYEISSDGSTLTMTTTITVYQNGQAACTGTYSARGTRQ